MRGRQLNACLLTAAAFLAGCDSTEPRQPTKLIVTPAATSSGQSLSAGATARSGALAAYRGMWNAFVAAGNTSDAESADVRKYSSDQALKLIVNALLTNRQLKRVSLGDVKLNPKVTAVQPADDPVDVSISDCVDDSKWLLYKTSGGLVDNVPGGRHRTTATVKRSADGWKVASFIAGEPGTC